MKRTASIMIARFPGNFSEHPTTTDWCLNTLRKMHEDDRIGRVHNWQMSDTPITMVRNKCVLEALDRKVDLLVMIDSDMYPDRLNLSVTSEQPFWESSFDWWYKRYDYGPSIIAAPYVGPPPHELPYIFRWRTRETLNPNPDWQLEMFTREEAAERSGIEEVAALPTGLILIDMRLFTGFSARDGRTLKLPPPWFEYEWTDKTKSHKASTEDVYFTRNASMMGCPCFVNWDAWAIHWKWKGCGKPIILPCDAVSEAYRVAMHNPPSNETMMVLPGSR